MTDSTPARPPIGSIRGNGRYPIDLTSPGSHMLLIEPGMGGLAIGPPQLDTKAALHVAPDARIDWTVFDVFATPAGSPWPRFLRYTGSDTGFFEWARQRPIEDLTWVPILPADTTVDASRSAVHRLHIRFDRPGGRLHLKLPKRQNFEYFHLSLAGDLSRFLAEGDAPFALVLIPPTSRRKGDHPFLLPDLGELHQVTSLTLRNTPLGQPISLECLSRFPNLKSLSLEGNFSGLELLASRVQLSNLELRFMPDLGHLPPLSTWPLLDRFIAFNVEEPAGKRLRQQLKARAVARPWTGHVSVTQLRKPEWWASEYGRPFSSWPKRPAKLANEAYDAAQAALAKARSIADAEAGFTDFITRFNTFKDIETAEREDIGEAVWQLSQSNHLARLGVTEDLAQRWFDAARDY